MTNAGEGRVWEGVIHRILKCIRQNLLFAIKRANDPSAGSPTETLLRLLLPLSDKVH